MSNLPEATRENTDALDAVGNTTKAVTKGYAIGPGRFSCVGAFSDYTHRLDALTKNVVWKPSNFCSMTLSYWSVYLAGAMLPFLFSAFLMESCG
ncbi:MAG: sodium/proton-translocating pyrophosphatase [Deinococcales bacterium]